MAFHRFCQNILHEAPMTIYGDGKQIRDFTYVDDVSEQIITASLSADVVGQVVNVGGGSPATPLLEAAALLEEISGKTSPKTFLERQKGDVFSARADMLPSWRGDFSGAKPKTGLKEGVWPREWEWMKKFVQSEDDEQAIKANVPLIVAPDESDLAQAKAEAKADKKAKRKAKAGKASGPSRFNDTTSSEPEAPES